MSTYYMPDKVTILSQCVQDSPRFKTDSPAHWGPSQSGAKLWVYRGSKTKPQPQGTMVRRENSHT